MFKCCFAPQADRPQKVSPVEFVEEEKSVKKPAPKEPSVNGKSSPDKAPQSAPPQQNGNAGPASPAAPVPQSTSKSQELPTCGAVMGPDGDPMDFPRPANEKQRLAKLRAMDAFARKPDDPDRFDHITELMKNVFRVKLAAITLVDEEVIRCRALTIAPPDAVTLPRKQFPCSWSLLESNNDVLIIEDMTKDPRTCKANLFSQLYDHGPDGVKFYAGAPLLTSEGIRLGVLCVLHNEPRKIHPSEAMILVNFAEMVVRELERDELTKLRSLAIEEAMTDNQRLVRAVESLDESLVVCRMEQAGWPIALVNQALTKTVNQARADIENKSFWDIFYNINSSLGEEAYAQAVRNKATFALTVAVKGQSNLVFEARFRPHEESYDVNAAVVSTSQAVADKAEYIAESFYFITMVPVNLTEAAPGSGTNSGTASALSPSRLSLSLDSAFGENASSVFRDVRLNKLLGKGAFGRVYKGFWDGAPVAVKIIEHGKKALDEASGALGSNSLDSAMMSGSTSVGRFNPLFEALLSVRLHSPNLVYTYKYATRVKPQQEGAEDEETKIYETWIIQEYADSGTLQQWIDKGEFQDADGKPKVASIMHVLKDIVSGVSHLHEHSVMHGDLTANNVLLTSVGKQMNRPSVAAKVADFGLSKVLEKNKKYTETDTFGTVSYMPHELLIEGKMSLSADIYSIGVLLWSMVTGKRPFANLSHAQIIAKLVARERLTFPADAAPAPVIELAEKCLGEAEQRPTLAELRDAVQSILDSA